VSRIEIPRRAFLAGLGLAAGGLALGIFPNALAATPTQTKGGGPPPNPNHTLPEEGLRPNAFVDIAKDGTVSIVCKRSEMGQGVHSSLHVLIADELGADLSRVRMLQATGDKAYGDQNTDGSHSVRGQYDEIRKLGATARTMLIAVAAKKWGVSAISCSARDHKIFHDKTKRSFAFADLVVEAAKLPIPKQDDVKLRPRSELPHANAPIPVFDGKDIVTGTATFGADIKLPGMLTAVVVHPPVVMGKVMHYDATKALAIPGVRKIVELPVPTLPYKFQSLGGLAVVAENTWAAMRGARLLEVVWDHGENVTYDSRTYREDLIKSVRSPGKIARKVGDVHQALAHATKKIEAEYYVPHLAHASMEPPAATAKVDENGAEIWTCTQNPQAAREEVAKALGIDESKVTIHVTLLGGGFGRKSKPDYVSEAALISREMKLPVRLQWTREDDVQHDYFHSVSLARFVAGLDAQNKIDALLIRSAFPPISSTFVAGDDQPGDGELGQGILDTPFSVPNVQAEGCVAPAHVRIGWLRSVHNIHHAFAISSFVDELAHARGIDTKAQWLELLGPPRYVDASELGVKKVPNYGATLADYPIDTARFAHVVERVAEISGWSSRGSDKNRALGLAVHHSFLSYIGVVAAVELDAHGKIRVDEAWIVADAGILVNPERVKSQLEGAFLFGTSIALYSQITAKGGAIEQSNFRDYRLARIADAPRKINIELVINEEKSGGVGEPGVPPVAPAIVNAVFALTGKRIRELPLVRSGMLG
jgi:isoquinoline 1-oxidoreductase beta subunit